MSLGDLLKKRSFAKPEVATKPTPVATKPASSFSDFSSMGGTQTTTKQALAPGENPTMEALESLDFASGALSQAPQRAIAPLIGQPQPKAQTFSEQASALFPEEKFGKTAPALGLAASVIGDPLNLITGGGTKLARLISSLKKTKEVGEAFSLLKGAGFADDIANDYSKVFVSLTDSKKIEEGLNAAAKLQNTTREASSAQNALSKSIRNRAKAAKGTTESVLREETTTGGLLKGESPQVLSQELSPVLPSGSKATRSGKKLSELETSPSRGTLPESRPSVNLDNLALSERGGVALEKLINDIRPELEAIRGKPLTHEEVLQAAVESDILQRGVSRENSLKVEAAALKTRQNVTAMANEKGVSADFIEQLKILSSYASDTGRQLGALAIKADPIENTTKAEMVKKLLDLKIDTDAIIKAAEGVDFSDIHQASRFYRIFVKPRVGEILDEFRYSNILSSPRTHIINTFSNLIQGTVLSPATRLASGGIDFIYSTLTGKDRAIYMSEVTPYYKGFLNATAEASEQFARIMSGRQRVLRYDLNRIPTNYPLLKPFQVVPRLLEGTDIFFRTLIKGGEKEAIAARLKKQGEELTEATLAKIDAEAEEKGTYYVFRQGLDPENKEGQGRLLSYIDQATSAVFSLRKIPGVSWFIPFVQTPMNIFKQGIEYSPLGLATLPGATNKTEQLAKTFIGSVVFLGAGTLALQGKTTWSAPTGAKEQEAFYNSGRQPYSIKIGDHWVAYSKIGPLAYPIAMASAFQWYLKENPKGMSKTSTERSLDVFNGISSFFADQSYMQGLQSLLEFASGETRISGGKKIGAMLGGQVVPLVSLQRWVTNIIDPVFRRSDAEFNLESVLQEIQKGIPGLSQEVPKIPGSTERQNIWLNAFSPVNITNINQRSEAELRRIRRQQERVEKRKK